MTAKAFKNFFVALTLFLISVPIVFSESKNPPKQTRPKNGHSVLTSIANATNKKRMPSSNILELILEDDILTIESGCNEDEFNVSFENEETLQTLEIPLLSVGERVSVTLDDGLYTVTASKTDGTSYSGYMEVY